MPFSRWQATIVDDAGNIVPNATITVRREISGLPLQSLYSDRNGTTPIANPATADSEGFIGFYLAGGAYQIVATSGAFSRTWRHVPVGTAGEFDFEDLLVGLSWQGAWATATLYTINDGVRHEGSAYICLADHTSSATDEPGTGASWTTYWSLLAERGSDEAEWIFDSTTASADPGTGEFRLNNATLASVTALYISESSADFGNPSFATWLALADDSLNLLQRSIITIRNVTDRSQFAMYYVNASLTDNGTWDTIPLTHIASNGGPFVAGARYTVSILRSPDPATGLCWAFSTTTTDVDPGAGVFRMNNATPASVTQIYLDDASALSGGTDISAWPLTWDDSTSFRKGFIIISQNNVPGNTMVFRVNSLVDNAGYTTFNVTYVTHVGSLFTNGARCTIDFTRNGDRGDPSGLRWLFDNATAMADPGSGDFRLNNATLSSVTSMAISDNISETGAPSAESWVLAWDDSTSIINGYLTLKDSLNPQNFAIYQVGAVTNNTGWSEVALTHVVSNGSFTNASPVSIEFVRTGDKGDVGDGIDFAATPAATPLAADLAVFGDISDSNLNKDCTIQQFVEAGGDTKFFSKLRVTSPYTGAASILVLTDADKLVTTSHGSANTLEIPPNASVAFSIGTQIDIQQIGAGQTTLTPGVGVTLNSRSNRLKLTAQWAGATIIKTATNTWEVFGDLAP